MLEFIEKPRSLAVKYRGRYLTKLRDVDNPCRQIFMHDDFVVKIDHRPSTSWKTRQTAREIEFYNTLTEDKEFFAQILDYGKTPRGNWWIKQKRYYPDDTPPRDWFYTIEALTFKYRLADLNESYDKHGNWMAVDGGIIVYDWGAYRS